MFQADTEIVVTMTRPRTRNPRPSALVRHFSDPNSGAVAGNVKVGNSPAGSRAGKRLEYITSKTCEKRAFHL